MGTHRIAKSALAVSAIVLVPWTVGLATELPHSAVARHWNIAWAGLDAAIAIGLALTSWLGRRRDRRVAPTATATAALMCADAWFDVCTSAPGFPFAVAVVEAAAEMTIVVGCLVIGLRACRAGAEQAAGGDGQPTWMPGRRDGSGSPDRMISRTTGAVSPRPSSR